MSPIHIMIVQSQESFNWLELIKDVVEILSTLLTIWVMIIGILTIKRLHIKGEEAIFNFFSRLSVYLELLKDYIGSSQKSVYYYMFADDIRTIRYMANTPT